MTLLPVAVKVTVGRPGNAPCHTVNGIIEVPAFRVRVGVGELTVADP
jgi:hypothetical protein